MNFKLTEQEANVVIQSLAKQPFEAVYQIIASMQRQAQKQLAPKPKKVKKDENQG